MTLLPLVAATYFIVSGGPYGLEELISHAGFDRSVLILLITPLLWGLPTALMVGELSSALPHDGGYYAWVRRALGPFWGFQEAWLSLAASVFDMALYPTLFVSYLGRLLPALSSGWPRFAVGTGLVLAAALVNLRGARAVGRSSLTFGLVLVAPFAVLCALGFGHGAPAAPVGAGGGGLLAGVLIAMWNFMGWDNASTFARDVHRPARTYPLAMGAALTLVTLTYLVPVLAVRRAGLAASVSWSEAAARLGGPWLELAIVLGGMLSAAATYNALVLSYSRLPVALARDGLLPAALGSFRVSVLACSAAYIACLGLGFSRLVQLDVLLYGLSLVLEFGALVALRLREPALRRPFRVPGGLSGAVAVGVLPALLIGVALVLSAVESPSQLLVGGGLVAVGPVLFRLART
jgi:amino acid transporter